MDHIDVPLSDLKVMLGIPGGRDPTWETAIALASTFCRCQRVDVPLVPMVLKNCAIVTKARDEIVDAFLSSDCNRLFWIDSDMEWTADQFMRMIALSKLVDVVGAAYPAKMDRPTFFVKIKDKSQIELGEYGLVDVDGMGLGFCVMARHVVEDVAVGKPRMFDEISAKNMAKVFRTDIHEGNFRGEDMAFFADIRELGYRVWIDPSIDLAHHGTKRYTGRFMDAFQVQEQYAQQNGECG